MLYAWDEKTPPTLTWVVASYGVLEPQQVVKTCKRGCCVFGLFGSMRLPRYWREATAEEIAEATKSRKKLKGAGDFWDMYIDA